MALAAEREAYAKIRKLLKRHRAIRHMDPTLRIPWDEGEFALIDWEPLDVLIEALQLRATIRYWREIARVGVKRARMDHTWGVGRWAQINRERGYVSQFEKREGEGT